MAKVYRNIELKLMPKKPQKKSLEQFFQDASNIWYKIITQSITDTKLIKGLSTEVLGSQFIQGMVKEFRGLLASQKELKKLGKSGRIKYNYKNTVTHYSSQPVKLKLDIKRIYIQKLGNFYARGFKQFENLDNYKIVTVKLLRKATGYYIHLTLEFNEPDPVKPVKFIGLDFGIKTQISMSNGYNLDYSEHRKLIKIESRIKRLQRALSRKIKGSRRFRKLAYLIRLAFEKLEFVKREIVNKIISVTRHYNLVFQNELVKQWHQSGFKGIRRKVQRTFLGKILSRMRQLPFVSEIDSTIATTKTCLKCDTKNNIALDNRIYHCNHCGYQMPRDMHSALNMLRFYGFSYKECMQDPRINFSLDNSEISKLQIAGISVTV